MKSITTYRLCLYVLLLTIVAGCNPGLNKRFTLWRNDKIPYGTYYAYINLRYLFSNAEIELSKKSPANNNYLYAQTNDEDSSVLKAVSSYLIIANSVKPSISEVNALFAYIVAGNHVFISARDIGKSLLDSLHLETANSIIFSGLKDSLAVSILDMGTSDPVSYSYPGRAMDDYFVRVDSSITTTLGRNDQGQPNFVKFSYEGGGSLYIHLAPACFTNFFLLHKKNKVYYDRALSFLPAGITTLHWDDYFRSHTNGESNDKNSGFSKLRAFLEHKVLSWAFWLMIILFIIIYLFESKRKQRMVPVLRPLKNTSLDFVTTIGRLYYQRKDNKNLAAKMTTHFLDHVRSRYHLPTSQLTEEFQNRLAYKSGYDPEALKDIISQLKLLEDLPVIDDDELLSYSNKLDKFYKQS